MRISKKRLTQIRAEAQIADGVGHPAWAMVDELLAERDALVADVERLRAKAVVAK